MGTKLVLAVLWALVWALVLVLALLWALVLVLAVLCVLVLVLAVLWCRCWHGQGSGGRALPPVGLLANIIMCEVVIFLMKCQRWSL